MKYFLTYSALVVFCLVSSARATAASTCTEYLRNLGGPNLDWTGRPEWQIENLEEEINTLSELSRALGQFQDGEDLEIGVYTAETRDKAEATERKSDLIRKFVQEGIYLSRWLPFFDGRADDYDGPAGVISFSQRSYRYGIWLNIRSRQKALTLKSFINSSNQALLQYSFTFPHPKSYGYGEYPAVRDLMEKTNFAAGKKLELIFIPQVSERTRIIKEIKTFGVPFSPVEKNYPLNLKTFSDGIKLTVSSRVELVKVELFLASELARTQFLRAVVFPDVVRH